MSNMSFNITKAKEMRPVGEVSDKSNKKVVNSLNNILANEFALFTTTLNFHWNVTGPRFHSLHIFLEGHYKELLQIMDDTAERIRVLDEHPLSTIKEMLSVMDLKEPLGQSLQAGEMLAVLLRDHLVIQEQIKEVISNEELFEKDPGTEDFLIGLLQKHEKMSWMLKSHLDNHKKEH